MKCIRESCDGKTKIVDSREAAEYSIRRRHACLKCGYRFTTYEVPSKEVLVAAGNITDKYGCSVGLACQHREREKLICGYKHDCRFKKIREEYEDEQKET